jgi:predicted HicB family RNase H-like nuclease
MSKTLQHRGYDGSVEFSAEDKMLHGRVIGIRDLISYGGTNVKALEKNFRDAIDEYLVFCEQRGKTPNAPFKGSFNVRLPSELHKRASMYADEQELSLNAVVQQALSSFLSHTE